MSRLSVPPSVEPGLSSPIASSLSAGCAKSCCLPVHASMKKHSPDRVITDATGLKQGMLRKTALYVPHSADARARRVVFMLLLQTPSPPRLSSGDTAQRVVQSQV